MATFAENGSVLVFGAHLHLLGPTSLESLLRGIAHVVLLDLAHVELLWSEHGSRSGDSDPADKGLCWDLVVLHRVKTDKRACASQASLAVNGDGT